MDSLQPTILIVDDEKHTRDGLRRLLEDEYDTYVAEDVRGAMDVLERESIDLVITDQSIAWMTGRELAAEIKKLKPEVPVVLLTGLIEERGGAGPLSPIDLLLAKPISYDGLRNALVPFSG